MKTEVIKKFKRVFMRRLSDMMLDGTCDAVFGNIEREIDWPFEGYDSGIVFQESLTEFLEEEQLQIIWQWIAEKQMEDIGEINETRNYIGDWEIVGYIGDDL